MQVLGIDIGGTGIKGSPVDTKTGKMLGERYRVSTPKPATEAALLEVIQAQVEHFKWKGPIGCGFPGVIRRQEIHTAANLDKSLVGINLGKTIERATGCRAWCLNDADAAGFAEMRFGTGVGASGVTLLITIGTGLGTALFVDRDLVPNCEMGHVLMRMKPNKRVADAETLASDSARRRDELSWKRWAKRFDHYLHVMHDLLWPELIILGGGGAEKGDKFLPRLKVPCPVKLARMGNQAGIIGAAVAAAERIDHRLSSRRGVRHRTKRA